MMLHAFHRKEGAVLRKFIPVPLAVIMLIFPYGTGRAEVKIVEADGTYSMGDNDSKIDARRIATQEAKRKALELAGSYVESMTQVQNYQLTNDEIKSYTAGILETEIVSEQMGGTTDHPQISIKARCKIDTDTVAAQIKRYRESEELKEQLHSAMQDKEALQRERDQLVKQLAAQTNKSQAAATQKKLDTVLAKEEANDETDKVWKNIGLQLFEAERNGQAINSEDLDKASQVLKKTVAANPQNLRARTLLAAVYQHERNFSAAEQELRAAIQTNPSNASLHRRLGDLFTAQGRYRDALREYHFVERMKPHNALIYYSIGMTYKAMMKCGLAVQNLNRFVKNPQSGKFPHKKDEAIQTIEECGGSRPGRRVRHQAK